VILSVVSQKGGTGKTTVATNLAACYATMGQEVLLTTARAAVAAADFIVIPTLPSKFDMLSTEEFIHTVINEVQAYKPVVSGGILLNQLQASTAIGRAAVEYLEMLRYPVFENKLHLYVAYREAAAAGKSVIEYDTASRAAGEFTAFFQELLESTRHA
jgi:cellulose biosynthesis protein BcsQ